jgi:hypothetical protein
MFLIECRPTFQRYMLPPSSGRRIIALMMEAARTSETSVDIQLRTWQYIPEDSELQCKLCCSIFLSHCFSLKLFKDGQVCNAVVFMLMG